MNSAKLISDKLYEVLENGDFTSVYVLFNSEFYKTTDTQSLKMIFSNAQESFGAIINVSLKEWKTYVSEGMYSIGEYELTYKVCRIKKNTKETIALKKGDNGKIQIVGYKINFEM